MTYPDVQDRPEPPIAGDETATLLGSLERQRATFAWKTGGPSACSVTSQQRSSLAPGALCGAGSTVAGCSPAAPGIASGNSSLQVTQPRVGEQHHQRGEHADHHQQQANPLLGPLPTNVATAGKRTSSRPTNGSKM